MDLCRFSSGLVGIGKFFLDVLQIGARPCLRAAHPDRGQKGFLCGLGGRAEDLGHLLDDGLVPRFTFEFKRDSCQFVRDIVGNSHI